MGGLISLRLPQSECRTKLARKPRESCAKAASRLREACTKLGRMRVAENCTESCGGSGARPRSFGGAAVRLCACSEPSGVVPSAT